VIAARPIVHRQRLVDPPTPEALLAALADRHRPVLAAFAGHVIVACDPIEVVTDSDVWDAVAISCAPHSEGPHTVAGGWIGLLGYDLGGTIERLPQPHPDPGGAPLASLGRYETVAVFDPYGGCVLAGVGSAAALRDLADAAADAREPQPYPPTDALVATSLDAAEYRDRVQRARALIRAGDCYQVNLTQRLSAPWHGSAMEFAAGLWAAAGPSSHRAYLGLPEGAVVSASPERLVRVSDGVAESEPIKGTAPLGEWERLSTSAKDRAEHVMIVDLVRNDLGRVAQPGGVSVPRLFGSLSTPYVEHMVSDVRAELRPGVSAADVLRAVFPGGSVTGTPKVRAMEVIRDLEPVARGPAFGSIVAVGTDGAVEASITIRTAWVAGAEVRYWCGGAVVWDSDPEAERAEAWAKAQPFLRAVGAT
jgi:anthranilate/para-aminobenzoate synthase component I